MALRQEFFVGGRNQRIYVQGGIILKDTLPRRRRILFPLARRLRGFKKNCLSVEGVPEDLLQCPRAKKAFLKSLERKQKFAFSAFSFLSAAIGEKKEKRAKQKKFWAPCILPLSERNWKLTSLKFFSVPEFKLSQGERRNKRISTYTFSQRRKKGTVRLNY